MVEYVSIKKEDFEKISQLLEEGLKILKKAVAAEFEGTWNLALIR